jgi:O-antigen ligase
MFGVFFAPETYFADQDFSISGADVTVGFPFGRYAFVLLLLWIGFLCWRMPKLMLWAVARSWLPIGFILWAIVTGYWTADPGASINRSFRVLLVAVFAAYLVERLSEKSLLRILTVSGAVAIVASVFAAVALPRYGLTTLLGYEGAWRGALLHKNSLGSLMVMIFCVSIYAYRTRAVSPRFGIFVALGSFFVVVMSKSATSLMGALVACATIAFLEFFRRLKTFHDKLLVMSLGLLSLVFVYLGYLNFDLILMAIGRDPTLTGRTDVWETAWYFIQQKPYIGHGSGFWAIDSLDRDLAWNMLKWAAPHAHSNFWDIWLQLGLVGLVYYAVYSLSGLFRCVRAMFRNPSAAAMLWPTILLTVLFGGLSETTMVGSSTNALFVAQLCFLALGKSLRQQQEERDRRSGAPALSKITPANLASPEFHASRNGGLPA